MIVNTEGTQTFISDGLVDNFMIKNSSLHVMQVGVTYVIPRLEIGVVLNTSDGNVCTYPTHPSLDFC
jgi:hypothetical protein